MSNKKKSKFSVNQIVLFEGNETRVKSKRQLTNGMWTCRLERFGNRPFFDNDITTLVFRRGK